MWQEKHVLHDVTCKGYSNRMTSHLSETCPYFQWNDENKKTSVASTLAEAQREAMKQLAVMKKHGFIAKTQLHQMHTLKQSLDDAECVIQEDFAENFNIKQQDEIRKLTHISQQVILTLWQCGQ